MILLFYRSPDRKRPRTADLENENSVMEAKFKRLNTPIYAKEVLGYEEILNLLSDTDSIEKDKV